jgi:hypothetical protein
MHGPADGSLRKRSPRTQRIEAFGCVHWKENAGKKPAKADILFQDFEHGARVSFSCYI